MPSLPTLREWGLPAEVSEFHAKTPMEGGLGVRARRLDNGLRCLTEDAAVQPHRGYAASSWCHHCAQRQASDCNSS